MKANAPKREPKTRKKRPHRFARPRSEPTEVIPHYPETCSCCGRALCGGWLHRVREVIEIPAGSTTVAVLMSLFSTWKRQALDTLDTCRQMLLGKLKPADT